MPSREHGLLSRYRAEVEALMEVPYDIDLLREHMKRNRIDQHRERYLEELVRELRQRVARFRAIEPVRYAELDKRLQVKYEERNAFNAHRSPSHPKRIGDSDAVDP